MKEVEMCNSVQKEIQMTQKHFVIQKISSSLKEECKLNDNEMTFFLLSKNKKVDDKMSWQRCLEQTPSYY